MVSGANPRSWHSKMYLSQSASMRFSLRIIGFMCLHVLSKMVRKACVQPDKLQKQKSRWILSVDSFQRLFNWRRERDLNPWYSCPYTRFPGVLLRPLGHLSSCFQRILVYHLYIQKSRKIFINFQIRYTGKNLFCKPWCWVYKYSRKLYGIIYTP